MNVMMTKLPGQFPGSPSGAASDMMNNQLGAALQWSTKSNQGSRGVASYSPLSVGLGGSRADLQIMSNTLGSGATMPIDPYVMSRASDGEQVNPSLLPPVPCSDRPTSIGNALDPTLDQQCLRPAPRSNKTHQRFVWSDNPCGHRQTYDRCRRDKRRRNYGATFFTQRPIHDIPYGGWDTGRVRSNFYEWCWLHLG